MKKLIPLLAVLMLYPLRPAAAQSWDFGNGVVLSLPTSVDAAKATYVAEQLKAKYPNLDEVEVQHLLEAAVLNVKAQLNAPAKGA